MPIYEYRCSDCEEVFEELMRLSDPDPGCPTCECADVTKLMSNTSFKLMGSGWYSTDYKQAPADSKTKSDSSDSATKTDAKSESSSKETASPPSTGGAKSDTASSQ